MGALRDFLTRDEAETSIEYVLMASMFALVVLVAAKAFAAESQELYEYIATSMADATN
jgi:hypothetical protein